MEEKAQLVLGGQRENQIQEEQSRAKSPRPGSRTESAPGPSDYSQEPALRARLRKPSPTCSLPAQPSASQAAAPPAWTAAEELGQGRERKPQGYRSEPGADRACYSWNSYGVERSGTDVWFTTSDPSNQGLQAVTQPMT